MRSFRRPPRLQHLLLLAPLAGGCGAANSRAAPSAPPAAAEEQAPPAHGEPAASEGAPPAPPAATRPSSLGLVAGAPDEEPLVTLPDAERALVAAATELDAALGAAAPEAPPPGGHAAAKARAAGAGPSPAGAVAGCEAACRALSSLRRAAEAICRLTAADDRRCVEARATVSRSETRAAACQCPLAR